MLVGTKEERLAVGRRIFEALCEHYPDHYIALIEQQGKIARTAVRSDALSRSCPWQVQKHLGPGVWARGPCIFAGEGNSALNRRGTNLLRARVTRGVLVIFRSMNELEGRRLG